MRVVVIGLGLFGTSVAEAVVEAGEEVLAIDSSEQLVQTIVDRGIILQAACVDATQKANLERLGVGPDYDVGVIGIGTNVENSIVSAIHLKDLGVKKVIAKGTDPTHCKILEKVGADETLIPEITSGHQAARGLLNPTVLEEMEFSDDYTILELMAPSVLTGKTLAESQLRQDYGANVIGFRRAGTVSFVVPPEHVLEPEVVLIVGVSKLDRRKLVQLTEQCK